MTHARLPAAPLRRVLLRLRERESLSWDELADRAGISSRHLFRLLAARTVSELVADELRANYTITRRWQPDMDPEERARGIAAWRSGVDRTLGLTGAARES